MARNIAPQDVSWFLDLHERKRLELNPPYQRKSVWTAKERKYFLDTVFSGYPCPPVFLYKEMSDQGIATYYVVDGKQRLETIVRFAENKLTMPAEFDDENLAGKKWKNLTIDQRRQFWNYQFAVEMLDVVDAATVKEIFGRYNRTSKNLEPQELRHAKYDGWFVTTAETEANREEWARWGISTTGKARRMRDVQFISELMIVVIRNGDFLGFDQDQIEEFYANYDNPIESDPDFSEEVFFARFNAIKNSVQQMDMINSCVTRFAKSVTHFYTLWSVLVNIQAPDINLLAARYAEFMGRVNEVSEQLQEELPQEVDPLQYQAPFTYAHNARGASTELPQRRNRYLALLSYLNPEL